MKNLLVLVALLSSASAMAIDGPEQCLVERPGVTQLPKNSLTSITLPGRGKGEKILLHGYSLFCDKNPLYCAYAAEINTDETQYTFDGDSIVTVKRNVHGKLTGSGSFQSPYFNGGEAIKLSSCKRVQYLPK